MSAHGSTRYCSTNSSDTVSTLSTQDTAEFSRTSMENLRAFCDDHACFPLAYDEGRVKAKSRHLIPTSVSMGLGVMEKVSDRDLFPWTPGFQCPLPDCQSCRYDDFLTEQASTLVTMLEIGPLMVPKTRISSRAPTTAILRKCSPR